MWHEPGLQIPSAITAWVSVPFRLGAGDVLASPFALAFLRAFAGGEPPPAPPWHLGAAEFARHLIALEKPGGDQYEREAKGQRHVERQDLGRPPHPDVVASAGREVEVDEPDRTPRVPLEVRRERFPSDHPHGGPVPKKPDGRLPRPVLGGVGQVGKERPGEELAQVEQRPIPGRHLLFDDPHRRPLNRPPPGEDP
jgi:hypothetical protein